MKTLLKVLGVILFSATLSFFLGMLFNKFFTKQYEVPKSEIPQNPAQQQSANAGKAASYRVPILVYHYIRAYQDPNDKLGERLSVSPKMFDQQMALLKKLEYTTITLEDFAHGTVKPKSVILTFDDGYEDAYTEAFPILQKYELTGTFFIVQNFIGKDRYMSKRQIEELRADGMEIGFHTLSHTDLVRASDDVLIKQVHDPTGKAKVFAYPAGKFDDRVILAVRAAGYIAAVTELPGFATDISNLLALPRVRVNGGESLTTFQHNLTKYP